MFYVRISFSVLLVLLCSFCFSQKSHNALVYEGNKKFDAENYEASSAKYLEAIAEKKDDYAAHYNLGNAFYKIKKYDLAAAEYEKASKLTKSKYEKAAALYNLGNVQMQHKKPEKAVEYYKKSLQEDPYNDAVRKNYEIARLKQKEKLEKEKQQKDQNQNKGKEGGKDPNDKDNSEDKENSNKQKEGGQGDKKKGKGEGSPSQSKKNENKIPKAVEESILNEIENREKETARRILNKNANRMPQSNEKDW